MKKSVLPGSSTPAPFHSFSRVALLELNIACRPVIEHQGSRSVRCITIKRVFELLKQDTVSEEDDSLWCPVKSIFVIASARLEGQLLDAEGASVDGVVICIRRGWRLYDEIDGIRAVVVLKGGLATQLLFRKVLWRLTGRRCSFVRPSPRLLKQVYRCCQRRDSIHSWRLLYSHTRSKDRRSRVGGTLLAMNTGVQFKVHASSTLDECGEPTNGAGKAKHDRPCYGSTGVEGKLESSLPYFPAINRSQGLCVTSRKARTTAQVNITKVELWGVFDSHPSMFCLALSPLYS
ncbi:hypothetical protein KCU61_g147, partial [Aureobasidium melanogenum]